MTAPRARSSRAAPVIHRLLGTLLRCPACGAAAGPEGVCGDCADRLRAAVTASEGATGEVAWLGPYSGPWLRLVQALKYRGQRQLAGFLGGLLGEVLLRSAYPPDLVTHVPVSSAGRRSRGFDQAELLAQAVAARLGLPHRAVLARHPAASGGRGMGKMPSRQVSLGLLARGSNAAGAFRARWLNGQRLLLIDDVLTTGATSAACQAELLAAGAAEVRLAVVARTVLAGAR